MLEQKFNYIIYKLKRLNYTFEEILQLTFIQAFEQIMFYDFDEHLKQYELITSNGVEFKDKKDRFNTFFKTFDEYFKDAKEEEKRKIIDPKPSFLKG